MNREISSTPMLRFASHHRVLWWAYRSDQGPPRSRSLLRPFPCLPSHTSPLCIVLPRRRSLLPSGARLTSELVFLRDLAPCVYTSSPHPRQTRTVSLPRWRGSGYYCLPFSVHYAHRDGSRYLELGQHPQTRRASITCTPLAHRQSRENKEERGFDSSDNDGARRCWI